MSNQDNSDGRMATYLKNNPRMIGVLFTLLVLLSQVGNAVASGSTSQPGP